MYQARTYKMIVLYSYWLVTTQQWWTLHMAKYCYILRMDNPSYFYNTRQYRILRAHTGWSKNEKVEPR
jgi:hypothetical protein